MTKLLTILLMYFFLGNCQSQIWVESNPEWYFHYEKYDLSIEFGEFKITNIGDSLIEGENCQMLQQEKSVWYETDGIGYYFTNEIVDTNYVRVDGDTVFYYQNGQFRVLYNFGSNVGDSWLTYVSDQSINSYDSTYVIITETGLVNIQGFDYRYIKLETIDFPKCRLSGTFVERFGKYSAPSTVDFSEGSLFPYDYYQNAWTPFFQTCFNDDSINYQAFNWCFLDPSQSGLFENNTKDKIQFYPNPFDEYLLINGGYDISEIEILDCQGKRLFSFNNVEELMQTNLYSLRSGIYFIKYKTDNQILTRSIIKK